MGDEDDVALLLEEILNRPEPERPWDEVEREEAEAREFTRTMAQLAEATKVAEGLNEIARRFKELGEAFQLSSSSEQEWMDIDTNDLWEIELLVENYEVIDMRLPRDRKGKTPIDVGVVVQDGLKRVRVSMGEDSQPGRKNSDLSEEETAALITLLQYNLALVKGDIEPE